jgi:HD-like signal output (HDOD) protein
MSWNIQINEDDLPVLSAVATEALTLLQKADVTTHQINDLIRQDPALASRVLHIANSPFYGGRCQTKRIADAVVRLGFRQLRNVLMVAATGELFDANDQVVRALWDHAVATAHATDAVAALLDLPQDEDPFLSGLLHDVGKLIIYRQYPAEYAQLIERANRENIRLYEIEDEEFKYCNHMSVGGLVVRKWSLPITIAEAARQHHLVEYEIPEMMDHKKMVCAVAVANVLVNNMGLGMTVCEADDLPHMPAAQHLGLDDLKLARLTGRIREILDLNQTADAAEA